MNELLNYLNNYAKNRKNKQRVSAIMVCLAVIVSFTVSVGLIEPAESASGELICGMEEHEHTQDCFELICGFDEETEEEIVVETTVSDSEETMESTTSTEETTTAATEPATTETATTETATTDTEITETIISTCTDESATVSVHIHNDECYRLICITEAHLHKQDCYNQPAETETDATETSTSTSTETDTTATTEQTTETTTITTELSEEIYELNAALFGELYKDRVSVLADAQTITKGGETYTYYEIEDVKFYYENEELYVNECFGYRIDGGTAGDNAHHPAANGSFNISGTYPYNGVEYVGAYNFDYHRNAGRYISFKAPEDKDGTLIFLFNNINEGQSFTIKVTENISDTNPAGTYSFTKDIESKNNGLMSIAVKKGTTYKIEETAQAEGGKARLIYAEFVPVPEAGKVYRIIDVETGKYVELSGTNIELGGETPSGDLSNDFKLTDAGDGSFYIYPQSIENKVIDYDVNNKNIHIYNSNSNNNQKFQFIMNDDGTYKIKSPGYNDSYWKVDGNNDIKTDSSAEASNFRIVEATEIVYPKADIDTTKTYLIKNVRSRQYIHMEAEVYRDLDGNIIYKKNYTDEEWGAITKTNSTEQIIQMKDVGADSQFKFISTGTAGEYYIVSADGNYALTTNWNVQNGADMRYESFDNNINSKDQIFHAEQMENGSIRFYQIDNNGKKFYLEINGQSTNTGADVDLLDANKVNDHQCFFLVPVIEPETVVDGKTRIEARVIFGDYNDGKITINNDGTVTDTRKRYDEPAYIPTFNLYGTSKIDEQKGNLVVDISIARKDWCYQYNYVWYQEAGSNYYVELDGVENNQITYNGKTFKVYYLHDDELGHPGNAPSNAYKTDPSALKVGGDQVVYIFLDPTDDRPNAEKFSLTMKKRWDGYNQEGYKNRPKEKIRVQLQYFDNGSNTWKKFEQDGYMNWYYYEVKNGDTEYKVNKNSVGITDYIYYKAGTLYTDKECKTEYKDLGKLTYTYLSALNTNNGTIKHLNPNVADRLIVKIVDSKEWNDILLTADGENNPQHFKDGYYYIWNDLPVGDYRVVETQSFYDANDNNVLDAGDRDTSHDYYYMSFPPSRDSSGVLHIQNFTKDMVIEVQKKWQDDKGGDMTLKNPIEFEVYRCLGDPRNSVPENLDLVGKFTTNENGYAFITSRAYDSNFDENSQGNGYYYGVHDMETKNGDTKYHYFIKEIVPDGYKLINGNEYGYVWRAGIDADSEPKDYAIDYEDGDSRKFIITNKAKIGLRVEKEWYNSSVSDENKIDYYNNNTDNPIYPKFKIYKGEAPGEPKYDKDTEKYYVEQTKHYSEDDSDAISRFYLDSTDFDTTTINNKGYIEIVKNSEDSNDLNIVDPDLSMTMSKGYNDEYKDIKLGNDNPKNYLRNQEATVDDDGRIKLVNNGKSIVWFGTNLIGKKGGTVSNPYITGTLTLEFVEYGDDDAVSIRNDTFGRGTAENKSIKQHNGIVNIPNVYIDGNYRITGGSNENTIYLKKVSFTPDAYYYIQEITNDNSNYTLSNGDDNGFVKIGDNFYTTITANNHYPVVTAQNIPKVNLDITKEWYADADMEKQLEGISNKSMKFKIYKAFAQGTPKETTVVNTASCYLESGNTTCSLSEYTGVIKVKNDSTTTTTVSRSNGYYTTPADGKLSIIELPAYDPVTENDKTIYKKVYYYIQEADGNFKLLNGNDCGFVQNGGNTYGTSFEDNGNYIFQNQPTIDLTVNKIWKNANGESYNAMVSTEIKFKVYRKIENGEFMPVPENGTDYVTSGLKKVIEGLDAYDSSGNKYTYYIKEIDGETYFLSGFNVKYNDKTNPEECAFSWNKDGEKPVINITNQAKPQNYELPETGGSGTHGCTAAGGTIVLLSAAALLLKRRKKMV